MKKRLFIFLFNFIVIPYFITNSCQAMENSKKIKTTEDAKEDERQLKMIEGYLKQCGHGFNPKTNIVTRIKKGISKLFMASGINCD